MIKPDWKDAPDWANYLAMDMDGIWYWYENEPLICDPLDEVWSFDGGKIEFVEATYPTWINSLEERPND